MGRSDPIVFPWYTSMLDSLEYSSVAFLGFAHENAFTSTLSAPVRHFYDRGLGNWEINSGWQLKQSYDLIVSTRCPYFARRPDEFVNRCREHLIDGGRALIDWGLGDHWRFSSFKVGWVRDGEHEHAYADDNFLWSCFWNDDVSRHPVTQEFWKNVRGKFGYNEDESVDDVVRREVPVLVDYGCLRIECMFLWPESPQLYIATLIGAEDGVT